MRVCCGGRWGHELDGDLSAAINLARRAEQRAAKRAECQGAPGAWLAAAPAWPTPRVCAEGPLDQPIATQ